MTWLFIPILISFLLVLLGLPLWIKTCRNIGLLWEDMNKIGHPKNVAASGGVVVVIAFIVGVLSYVAITSFVYGASGYSLQIFAMVSMILVLALIGLVDDLLGWRHGGLSWKLRLVFALVASIPLVVIKAGTSAMILPFLGAVDFGVFYALVLIPLGVAGVTTVYNFLAGFNGLESGQGILVLSFLSYVAYATGSSWLALIGLCMVAALLVFFLYNKSPAKVFPGDIMTYAIGALIVGMAILGNFERIAAVVFVPYLIEMVLKVRGKIKLKTGKFPHSFGIPDKDGNLKMPYKKIYGLTHFSIWFLHKFKKGVTEKDVVYFLFIIQIIFIFIGFLML